MYLALPEPAFPSVQLHPLQVDQHNETRRSICAVLQQSKQLFKSYYFVAYATNQVFLFLSPRSKSSVCA